MDTEFLNRLKTPFWYYDIPRLRETAEKVSLLSRQYDIQVHYATKANAQLRIVREFARTGFGADCVSRGEILLALQSGVDPASIFFTGVGKSDDEILYALREEIGAINCESVQELHIIDSIAGRYGLKARVCIRINPNIDAKTFRYVTSGLYVNKFGISPDRLPDCFEMLSRCHNLEFLGLHFHIGSQVTAIGEVTADLCSKAVGFMDAFEKAGFPVKMLNLGGGLGVNYDDPDSEAIPDFETWFKTIDRCIPRREGLTIHVEPGRSLVAQCCTLMSHILYVKENEVKTFLVVDAGMNNLVRPAFYGAYHKIENYSAASRPSLPVNKVYDIVGPVCESSDTWGKDRRLPLSVRGDLVGIRSAGAYGESMSNRYNLRPDAQVVFSDALQDGELAQIIL